MRTFLSCLSPLFFLLSCSHTASWPQDREISCDTLPPPSLEASLPSLEESGVWQLEEANEQELLKARLAAFHAGQTGQKARQLKLQGLSAAGIHSLLLAEGFRHQRVALVVHPLFAADAYWLRDGSQHQGLPDEEQLLPMDIYDHPDGSLVRLKAWGIPDPQKKTPRPQPHASKSVVFHTHEECDFMFFNCHLNVSWDNEAFKVSDDGQALPKAPTKANGFYTPSQLSAKAQKQWIDKVMARAHIDLPIDFTHCPQARSPKPLISKDLLVINQQLTEKVTAIFAATGLAKPSSLAEAIALSQKHWLRPAGKERWEMPHSESGFDTPRLMTLFQDLHMLSEIRPRLQRYDYILVLGATAKTLRSRFAYLVELWSKGLVTSSHLVFLVGQRPIAAAIEDRASLIGDYPHPLPLRPHWRFTGPLPKTETELAQLIVAQTALPPGLSPDKISFIDTPMQKNARGENIRPTTKDTVDFWFSRLKNPTGTILAISSNPYCGYQHAVLEASLSSQMQLETIGKAMENSEQIPLLLDSLARWLYQYRPSL